MVVSAQRTRSVREPVRISRCRRAITSGRSTGRCGRRSDTSMAALIYNARMTPQRRKRFWRRYGCIRICRRFDGLRSSSAGPAWISRGSEPSASGSRGNRATRDRVPLRRVSLVLRYYFGMSRNSEDGRFDAIAHPARRAILMYLRDHSSARAGDISRDLEIVPSTLSGHLRVLREADLIVSSRRGTEIWYRTNFTVMEELLLCAARLLGNRRHE